MPLVADILKAQILTFSQDPLFPKAAPEAAQKWAQAIGTYSASIIPPSITVTAAQAALMGSLSGVNADAGNFAQVMQTGMVSFAAMVGAGMAPAFVAVPPAGPPVIQLAESDDADKSAEDFAKTIDSWMKTGMATPAAGGPPTPWS